MRCLALFLALAVCCAAAGKPGLSGTWTLAAARSDFAKQPAPKSKIVRIEHREPSLVISIEEEDARGAVKGTAHYTTGGRECVNDIFGNPMKAVAVWEGETLYMRTWGSFAGNEIKLDDRYTLSKYGKTLTLRRHFEGQRGGVEDQILVHEKQ